jgi:hypothetical protein
MFGSAFIKAIAKFPDVTLDQPLNPTTGNVS